MNRIKISFLFFCLCSLPVFLAAQSVTVSGLVRDEKTKTALPYVNVSLKAKKDSSFVTGTITNESGVFSFPGIKSGTYVLEAVYANYASHKQEMIVGTLSLFLDLGNIGLKPSPAVLDEVTVSSSRPREGVSEKMDKKVFTLANNISQSGGSVLQAMQNLPGVTVQDGKVQLRGNDKVAVLIDGKQNAITGFGSQTGLDNIPASAIERIEIINNPSAIYDANGNAGIINIIYKKNKQEGFNGKIGLTTGLGALWRENKTCPRSDRNTSVHLSSILLCRLTIEKTNSILFYRVIGYTHKP